MALCERMTPSVLFVKSVERSLVLASISSKVAVALEFEVDYFVVQTHSKII
jgi:hypothetical protein